MKTKEQIQKEFLEKFDALLLEYSAVFSVDDHYCGYSEFGQDLHATVIIDGKWDENGNIVSEPCNVELRTYRNPSFDKIQKEKAAAEIGDRPNQHTTAPACH